MNVKKLSSIDFLLYIDFFLHHFNYVYLNCCIGSSEIMNITILIEVSIVKKYSLYFAP